MKKLWRWILSIILLFLIAIGALAAWAYYGMQPVASSDQAVQIEIQSGTGSATIADKLQQEGLIKSSLLFKGYLKVKSQGSRFQAGVYQFEPGVTYQEIIAKLNAGEVVEKEMVRFTIPEGFTVAQIGVKLAQEGIVDQRKFKELVKTGKGFTGNLVQHIPNSSNLMYTLEGYLFPETYEMKKGSTDQEIIERMLAETQKRLDTISDLDAKLKQQNLTLNEMMTLASLIEREVVVDAERSKVAGVIYNRLAKDMKLEIDATVQYLLEKPKERLYNSDLRRTDSPYNTYLYAGLPPGPIAAPSMKSIEAALAPESSDYLFYVTKKDGSGEHLFAKTYKEHLNNIKKSKAMAK